MNFKNVVYWAILIFLAAIFLVGGVEKLMAMEYWQARFVSQWGLPAWMAPMIGVTEMLGGLMLLVPRLTALGAAVIVIVMFGATATQIVASEWLRIIVPLVVGTMAGILFKWSLLRAKVPGAADAAKNSH
jgi:uncharacterized membrane protein YphA (DoxX/SURF4 family)|tara:strand:+ start:139 stop:528 length:390 start_codon:yes stop_codon:yes gene_type:complete